jgi:DHA2 family multidrug resistance protein-like MFS transporter
VRVDVLLIVTGLTFTCAGISVPMALMTNVIMGAAPPEKAGSAASLSETSGEFGIALGVAVMGSLGSAQWRPSARSCSPDSPS